MSKTVEERLDAIEEQMHKLYTRSLDHHHFEECTTDDTCNVVIEKGSITITSPNGEHKITLTATDKGSGIWLQGADKEPYVAIYNGYFDQGAVVAVTGYHDKDHPMKAHDAAIMAGVSTYRNSGGIQLTCSSGEVHQFSADELVEKKDDEPK